MIFNVQSLIEYISKIMTLEKGDLILTGTPEGVGEIFSGDFLESSLNNICSLKVNVE